MNGLLRRLSHLERLLGRCFDPWHQTVQQVTTYGPGDPFDRDQTPPELSFCPTCHAVQPVIEVVYVHDWRGAGKDNTPAPSLN